MDSHEYLRTLSNAQTHSYTLTHSYTHSLTCPRYTVPPHSAKDCAHYGSCAYQVDTYHLPPTHTDKLLEPSFTYHGFRYVEVVVEGVATVEAGMLRAYFVHTDVDTTATFSSNNSQLNALQVMLEAREGGGVRVRSGMGVRGRR